MDAKFWHQRWKKKEIAFHEKEANPLLVDCFKELGLAKGSRVFLPLCGKTLDISWLVSNGYHVCGAELSKIAIDELFQELGVKPSITRMNEMDHYSADGIDIFVGDIFHLSGKMLGKVHAIYDRAALVALPEDMRKRYTKHLLEVTGKSPQLLICFEYDQSLQNGPPFSISNYEVQEHYKEYYNLNLIASKEVIGGLKGKCPAVEKVWLLQK